MKSAIHPNYVETVIVCACGATYRKRSTCENIKMVFVPRAIPFSLASKNSSTPPVVWTSSNAATELCALLAP